jgi:UTP--glucose-1-phosphate uridylyltransferase
MSDHQKIVKAVIPAAGFGTRMLPATKALPKEMLPVARKPLIQFAVEEAAATGIETVIIVVGRHKSLVQAHFNRNHRLQSFLESRQQVAGVELVRRSEELADLRYVEQEEPRGLAHAISCARPLIGDEPFAVLLPDVVIAASEPATHQLIRAREEHGGSVVAVREIEPGEMQRHGVVGFSNAADVSLKKSILLSKLVEKPRLQDAPSRIGVFGRYLLEPAIWNAIAKTGCDPRGEVQLTEALHLLCQDHLLYGYFFEGQHYDVGDQVGFLKANIELSLQDPLLERPLREYFSELLSRVGSARRATAACNDD